MIYQSFIAILPKLHPAARSAPPQASPGAATPDPHMPRTPTAIAGHLLANHAPVHGSSHHAGHCSVHAPRRSARPPTVATPDKRRAWYLPERQQVESPRRTAARHSFSLGHATTICSLSRESMSESSRLCKHAHGGLPQLIGADTPALE